MGSLTAQSYRRASLSRVGQHKRSDNGAEGAVVQEVEEEEAEARSTPPVTVLSDIYAVYHVHCNDRQQ